MLPPPGPSPPITGPSGGTHLSPADALRMAARLTNNEEDVGAVPGVVLALLGADETLEGTAAERALQAAGVPEATRRLLVAAQGPDGQRPTVAALRAGLDAGADAVGRMPAPPTHRLGRLLHELRGRRVLRTALWYVGGSVALVEAAGLFVPTLGGGDAAIRLLTIAAACGLPLALVLSWFYDVAPARRTRRWAQLALVLVVASGSLAAGTVIWRGGPAAPVASAAPLADAAHLAVVPFTAVGGGEELAALAEQLQVRLIDGLGEAATGAQGTRQLRVLSHAGVLPFTRGGVNVDSLRERRGVGTLLEGSVEQVGDQLGVSIRLVDTSTGDQLFSSRSIHTADRIALLDAVADSVTQLVRKRLGDVVRRRLSLLETRDPAAFERLMLAEQRIGQFEDVFGTGNRDAARRIVEDADSMLAAATRLDGRWVEPVIERGRLAKRYARLALMEEDTAAAEAAIRTGVALAQRALELKPGSSRALELRGDLTLFRVLLVPPESAPDLRRAAERDLQASLPGHPAPAAALRMLSEVAAAAGRLSEALAYGERALKEDPFMDQADYATFRLFEVSFAAGQDSSAAQWCSEGRAQFPHPIFEDCRLALAAWSDAYPLSPDSAWRVAGTELNRYAPALRPRLEGRVHGMVAATLARASLSDSARAVLQRARARDSSIGMERVAIGVHHLLGDRREALTRLEALLRADDGARAHPGQIPELRGVLAEPEAAALRQRLAPGG